MRGLLDALWWYRCELQACISVAMGAKYTLTFCTALYAQAIEAIIDGV